MEPMALIWLTAVPWTTGGAVWLITYPDPATGLWLGVLLPAAGFALLAVAALAVLGAICRRSPAGTGGLDTLDEMLGERS